MSLRHPQVQSIFSAADLTAGDWLAANGVASTVLWVEGLRKLTSRRRLTRTNLNPTQEGER